jgi:2-polyprenyl-3-methyl-5-hydroxy-6-metoxy-1,4-benzoquinol methylase
MKKIKTITKDFLVQAYQNSFHIDIRGFFPEDLKEISLFEDTNSGLLYYDPPITGDSEFYEQLEKFDWYYMDWKWEYEKALEIIRPSDTVLEIGSGKGAFLKNLKERGISAEGIEFNQKQLSESKSKGLNVSNLTIEELIQQGKKFDVVVSFQVMEHIPNVEDLISLIPEILKLDARLIISVPNNDSFLGKDARNILNMPPHHVTLWSKKYFEYLKRTFNFKQLNVYYEPLQDYHYEYFYNVEREYYLKVTSSNLLSKVIARIKLMIAKGFPSIVKGFTILAVLIKK